MNEDTLITASYAIMVKKGQQKAAAAVVGFRFKQSALQQLFQNHSTVSIIVVKIILFLYTSGVAGAQSMVKFERKKRGSARV